ncbi:rod shape-determining protein MreC [Pandoraea sp.]|uniref:rod shape-determining protein MreC n=1 Tax=Pandoraea sp. TaxID=1883445 RepID=UPI0012263CE4|nr:rod shape-determining protein MreC [Pandoraea sp.]TAL57272.1 MAG: rod shape-determining protein MreC [Pandoraea sp.]TAM16479.1 MAG: rod shape-determining protein MreC [Pandoraea sp.]
MQYSPPPLFKQGPSALARLICFVALAVGLLVVDSHYKTLENLRYFIGTALYPLQRVMLVPRDSLVGASDFLVSEGQLRAQNRLLRERNLELSAQAMRNAELSAENDHLRQLLALRDRMQVPTIPAQIEYDTRDPFTQKVVIDRGSRQGVKAGAPVITEQGLLGQVTRVFLMYSEVTLITDKDQAVPVQLLRSGVNSVVYGGLPGGALDLRFIPLSADVKVGDQVVTNGLGGVYPAGVPVARVTRVDKQSDTTFARIVCQPVAQLHSQRQVLVLQYNPPPPPPTEAAGSTDQNAPPTDKNGKDGKKGDARKTGKPQGATAHGKATAAPAQKTPEKKTP